MTKRKLDIIIAFQQWLKLLSNFLVYLCFCDNTQKGETLCYAEFHVVPIRAIKVQPAVVQMRRGNRDNLGIIFHFAHKSIHCDPSLCSNPF